MSTLLIRFFSVLRSDEKAKKLALDRDHLLEKGVFIGGGPIESLR